MAVWLTRVDVSGKQVAEPLYCLSSREIVAEPGVRSYRECLAVLVAPDEICTGETDERPILKSSQVVGYIAVAAPDPRRS